LRRNSISFEMSNRKSALPALPKPTIARL